MPIETKALNKLKILFKSIPEIKIVYLFGSQATGKTHKNSDFDFAVYLDPKKTKKSFDILITLSGKISYLLKKESVDVLILNTTHNLILKNSVITQGIVLYEIPGFRLNFEISTIGEYRDFRILEGQYYKD